MNKYGSTSKSERPSAQSEPSATPDVNPGTNSSRWTSREDA